MRLVSGFRPFFITPVFAYQSELLNPEMAASSALRMVVGSTGVSLLVSHDNGIKALKSWQIAKSEQGFQAVESEIRGIFGSEPLLNWQYKTKTCVLSSPDSTLVPRRLFEPENLAQYFKLLLQPELERSYGFEKLVTFDCYLVWAAETSLVQLCGAYFSSDRFIHLGGPLLDAYHQWAPTDNFGIFANLRGQKVQIAVFERRNLVFFNTFDFLKSADLLYFILLVYKQFGLNPLGIPLTISGTLVEDSEIFRLLIRYVRIIQFSRLPEVPRLPKNAKDLPEHYWLEIVSV